MPENPEIQIYTDQLDFLLQNRILNKLVFKETFIKKCPKELDKFNSLLPLKIDSVKCKGKLIWFNFGNITLFSKPQMTGKYTLNPNYSHIHVEFHLEKINTNNPLFIDKIFYSDVRRFGNFEITFNQNDKNEKISSIANGFIGEYKLSLNEFLENSKNVQENKRLKKDRNLIDIFRDSQSLVCSGIGNYLVSEILYKCELNPMMSFNKLSTEQLKLIYKNAKSIIKKSYQYGGVSLQDYSDVFDNIGEFSDYLEVYGKCGKLTSKDEKVFKKEIGNGTNKRSIFYTEKQIKK